MIFDVHGRRLTRLPSEIGAIVFIGPSRSRMVPYRRKAGGRFVTARRGMDPTLKAAYHRRHKKRETRMLARLRYLATTEYLARPSYHPVRVLG